MKLVRAKKNLTHQYHNENAIFWEDEINNILVYPNPDKGCFNIDFTTADMESALQVNLQVELISVLLVAFFIMF